MGLALLAHSNLPQPYWEDTFLTATYLINRLPSKVINNKSPFEMAYNKKPTYLFLRVFGCACWPNLRPYNKHKIDFYSKTCIFLGYSLSHQGYKCLDLASGKLYVSRHVIFYESLFPYQKDPSTSTLSTQDSHLPPSLIQPSIPNNHPGSNSCLNTPLITHLIPLHQGSLDIQSAIICSDGIPAPAREPSQHFNIVEEPPLPSDNLMPRRMITRSQT
jgi:histone deacetylase 1/2